MFEWTKDYLLVLQLFRKWSATRFLLEIGFNDINRIFNIDNQNEINWISLKSLTTDCSENVKFQRNKGHFSEKKN